MSLSLQEYVVRATENKVQDLLAAAVAADKHDWKPLGSGRTVIDLIAECAVTNEMSVRLLQERVWDDAGQEARKQAHAALDTLDKACACLEETTRSLVTAIRALPDEALTLEITLPGETSTVGEDLLHPYWNMAYHEGQINYIHSLS